MLRLTLLSLAVLALAFGGARAEDECVCVDVAELTCPTKVEVWWNQLDIVNGNDAYGHLSYFFVEDIDNSYTNDVNQNGGTVTSFFLENYSTGSASSSSIQLGASFYMGDYKMQNVDGVFPSITDEGVDGNAAVWDQANFQVVSQLMNLGLTDVTTEGGDEYKASLSKIYAEKNLQTTPTGYFTEEYDTTCGKCYFTLFIDAHKEADVGTTAEDVHSGQDTALAYTIFQKGDDYYRGAKENCTTYEYHEPLVTDGPILEYASLSSDTLPSGQAVPPSFDLEGTSIEGFIAYDPEDGYRPQTEEYYFNIDTEAGERLWESPEAGHILLHYFCIPDQSMACEYSPPPPPSPTPPPPPEAGSPSPSPSPEPSVSGDPHFIGFNGVAFDYHGVQGASFNLISTPQYALNALLGPDLINGLTYMAAAALQTADGTRVQVTSATGTLVALLNDVPVEGGVTEGGVTVELAESTQTVTVSTADIELVFALHGDLYLDVVRASLKTAPTAIAGVLGETAQAGYSTSYEHEDEHFFVTDMWATDFADNLFGTAAVAKAARIQRSSAAAAALVRKDIVSQDAVVSNFQTMAEDN